MSRDRVKKVVLVGGRGSGKSAYIRRLHGERFVGEHVPTLGVEIHQLQFYSTMGGVCYVLWDAEGDMIATNWGNAAGFYGRERGGAQRLPREGEQVGGPSESPRGGTPRLTGDLSPVGASHLTGAVSPAGDLGYYSEAEGGLVFATTETETREYLQLLLRHVDHAVLIWPKFDRGLPAGETASVRCAAPTGETVPMGGLASTDVPSWLAELAEAYGGVPVIKISSKTGFNIHRPLAELGRMMFGAADFAVESGILAG